MISVFAPAKVNLTLHVTGQLADGYHLLDSLVVFPNLGDRLEFRPTERTFLNVHGKGVQDLPLDGSNLVIRAANAFAPQPLAIDLHKALPIAAGIGGGSADAAATIRACLALSGESELPDPDRLLALGADVIACLASQPTRMRGIGEYCSAGPTLPSNAVLVLVNPRVAVSTPRVFEALQIKTNAAMPRVLPAMHDVETLCGFLASQRNDLQTPAITEAPIIAEVLSSLGAVEGCHFARMSGSGATCFGIFSDPALAANATAELSAEHPDWWVAAGDMITPFEDCAPKLS